MADHFKIICRKCKTVINQCRCFNLNKKIRYDVCQKCNEEEGKTEHLINEIFKARLQNNKNWMDLIRLVFKHAPKEAKKIVKNISECDEEITKLTKELAK